MKEWPKQGTVDFEELVAPLRKAVSKVYNLKRKNEDKDIPYNGYGFNVLSIQATSLNPEEALTAENLRYSDEDQGRDPMTTIISLAVQLGICQGYRVALEEQADRIDCIDILIGCIESCQAPIERAQLIGSLRTLLRGLAK